MRIRVGPLKPGVFLAVIAVAAAWCATTAPVSAAPVEYTAGHADIGVAYESGDLHVHYHFGSNAVIDGSALGSGLDPEDYEFAPDDVLTRVPDSQMIARPAGAQWDFLGVPAGDDLWYLPQSSMSGVPFLGFGTEDLDADWNTPIGFALSSLSGPGYFSVWTTDFVGSPLVKMSSSDGISGTDSLQVNIGSHSHFNWGFTAPGVYQVGLTASGSHAVDGLRTDYGVFTFLVGDATQPVSVPEPGSLLLAMVGMGGFALLAARRRRAASTPA